MQAHGVAVLPEGMSQERFDWLAAWVTAPDDIIRTPGTESNVKEIYDKCAELDQDPDTVIFNQFSEFGNHLGHYTLTGARHRARLRVASPAADPELRLTAFTSATGSAGAIAAGDYLKEQFGTRIAAVEALECPTLLYNGFGEHNIQGIGDKHVPLIHNAMNTDFVVDISDRATDNLLVLFNTEAGREHLRERMGVPQAVIDQLCSFGFSSICNVLAAIKVAKQQGLGRGRHRHRGHRRRRHVRHGDRPHRRPRPPRHFDAAAAGEVRAAYLDGVDTADMLECTHEDRLRMFNLGYYTWVEQQGVPFEEFTARESQDFWAETRSDRAPLGRHDRRLQRQGGRVTMAGAAATSRLVCAGLRDGGAGRDPFAWACPAAAGRR